MCPVCFAMAAAAVVKVGSAAAVTTLGAVKTRALLKQPTSSRHSADRSRSRSSAAAEPESVHDGAGNPTSVQVSA